jgi:hypothetical protein
MGRQHLRDGGTAIYVKQQKTGWEGDIPITQDLARALEAVPAGDMTFLMTAWVSPLRRPGSEMPSGIGVTKPSYHGTVWRMGFAQRDASNWPKPAAQRSRSNRSPDIAVRPRSIATPEASISPVSASRQGQNRNAYWKTLRPVFQYRPLTHWFIWRGGQAWRPKGGCILTRNQISRKAVGHFFRRRFSRVFGMSVPPAKASKSNPHAIFSILFA